MLYVGVDPGASGAIAVLDSTGAVVMCERNSDTESEVATRLEECCRGERSTGLIERVHSMPRQGVVSSFKFGQSYGFLRGVLTAIGVPFEEVTPQMWQKAMGCLSKGDKNMTKQKAGQLFPGVRVAHWNADALLIAEYCRRRF